MRPLVLCISLLVFTTFAFSQTNTITVTGAHEVNLSPNEILVGIDYQEYFYEENEEEIKVPIEVVEQEVLAAIAAAGVPEDKVTLGGARIVRPYVNRVYQKRRIQKSLLVCVSTTETFLALTRSVEDSDLFDRIVTGFDIQQFRHTEREAYLTLCRSKAFENAKEKAELILGTSGQSVGKALIVKEMSAANNSNRTGFNPDTYEVVAAEGEAPSGFAPVKVSYQVEVVFELL